MAQKSEGPRPTRASPPRTAPKKTERTTPDAPPPAPDTLAKVRARKLVELPPDLPDKDNRERAQKELLGEGRIGDETVTAKELLSMGTLVAARHLMVLLAKKRSQAERRRVLEEVGTLLIEINQPATVRRLLLEMPDAGRIVDIYPLEVLAYVLENRPDLVPGFAFGQVVLNKRELESNVFEVEHLISIKVPLSLKMRAFALEGGGQPGYAFTPGAPGEYHLEMGEAGTWPLLVRGDVRKLSLVDRVKVRLAGPGDD
jgi:hypothetical protein